MRRALLAIAIGIAASQGAVSSPTRAATPAIQPRITNISVAVSGGIASYYICVLAPLPPGAGAVTVQGPRGNQQAPFQSLNQSCGPNSTLMQATFPSLPAGHYLFQAACVLLEPDRSGNAGPPVPCLLRNVGFVSNFQGLTVAGTCQVDFDPSRDAPPQSCSAPGVAGNLAGGPTAPSATASPTPAAQPGPVRGAPPPAQPGAVPWTAPPVTHAFFAEGYTGVGYHEYLTLLNPRAQSTSATIDLYRADAATRIVQLQLPGFARRSLDLNALAPSASVAVRVEASGEVAVERALYTPGGSGHIVAGASLPARRWYVAEGYVGQGFADGLRIFNPYDRAAALTITAYDSSGRAFSSRRALQGGKRLNLALDDIAPQGASAVVVDSDEPVVVESIVSRVQGRATSAAMALNAPSRAWFFPDGGTRSGNQEYISLFNPGAAPVSARLVVLTGYGYARTITAHVAPHARASVALHTYIHQDALALVLQANHPVVAQEVRYTAGSAVSLVDGVAHPAHNWGLAEGYSGGGFSEWITLLNPGSRPATVSVRLIGAHGVPANLTLVVQSLQLSRLSMNSLMPRGAVSAVIHVDRSIVAGRTLTFDGAAGLSTTSGVALGGR